MRQGEIRARLDRGVPGLFPMLVLSGPHHLAADGGRVVVCPVLPGVEPDDYAGVHRVTYNDPHGTDTIGLAVPELLTWLPASAFGMAIGYVRHMGPILATVRALLV